MANYLFEHNYYNTAVTIGSQHKLSLEYGRVLDHKSIPFFIEQQLPEKTAEYKKSLQSDKGFLKSKLIHFRLMDSTAIKYIKQNMKNK